MYSPKKLPYWTYYFDWISHNYLEYDIYPLLRGFMKTSGFSCITYFVMTKFYTGFIWSLTYLKTQKGACFSEAVITKWGEERHCIMKKERVPSKYYIFQNIKQTTRTKKSTNESISVTQWQIYALIICHFQICGRNRWKILTEDFWRF